MDENSKHEEQEIDNLQIEMLFKESDIDEIWNHQNPLMSIYELIEKNLRVKTGQIDFDSNLIMTLAEFHVNNLIYFKENFKFSSIIYCKLMNLMTVLLNLKEDKENNNSSGKMDPTKSNDSNLNEIDYSLICRNKLKDLKKGFIKLELIENKGKKGENDNNNLEIYYLKNNEIAAILQYVNNFYFHFIRLYYHFINVDRITENKKIDVIINRPLIAPPLNDAVKQIQEKVQFDEQNAGDGNEENKDV